MRPLKSKVVKESTENPYRADSKRRLTDCKADPKLNYCPPKLISPPNAQKQTLRKGLSMGQGEGEDDSGAEMPVSQRHLDGEVWGKVSPLPCSGDASAEPVEV